VRLPRLRVRRCERQRHFGPAMNCCWQRGPCQGEALRSLGSWRCSALSPHGTQPTASPRTPAARPGQTFCHAPEETRQPASTELCPHQRHRPDPKPMRSAQNRRKACQNLVGGFKTAIFARSKYSAVQFRAVSQTATEGDNA